MVSIWTRRQAKYKKLRWGDAFLPFEAHPLSKIPPALCPYFQQLVKDRREELRQARKAGLTKTQWEAKIKNKYRDQKWLSLNRKGEIVADPWKMLRDYEDRWRAKQPEYTSPWQKRCRDWKDFQAKIERTLAKQRGLG